MDSTPLLCFGSSMSLNLLGLELCLQQFFFYPFEKAASKPNASTLEFLMQLIY